MLTMELVFKMQPPPCSFMILTTGMMQFMAAGDDAVHGGSHIELHDLLEMFRGVFGDRLAVGHACIVDQDVDLSVGCSDLFQLCRHGLFVSKVRPGAGYGPVRIFLLQCGESLVYRLLPGAEQHHSRSVFQKFFNSCKSDSSGSAGDHGYFSF